MTSGPPGPDSTGAPEPVDVRAALEREQREASARVAELGGDVRSIVDAASSTTGDDEHDPEGATIGFERAQAQALLAQAERRLAEVVAALERLASGRYGQCVRCGRAVGADRLSARPAAAYCIDCAASP